MKPMISKFIDAIKEHGIKLLESEFHADKVGKYADTFTEQDLQQLLSELEEYEKAIKLLNRCSNLISLSYPSLEREIDLFLSKE